MKILIADKFEKQGLDRLAGLGCRIVYEPGLSDETLADAIATHDPDILIVRSTKVTPNALDRANALLMIIRAGAGYDTIDVAGASARGISVCNCPGKNSIAVAELAWGLILACDRRIPDQVVELRERRWNKKEYAKARGLYGCTLGIVGLGQIGVEVARRGRAFGMNVIAWSRSLNAERAAALEIERCDTPIDLARRADVISIHLASNHETDHLVNREFCEAMREGAYLINTARGNIVDEEALREAIRSKGIRVGLDVFAREPAADDPAFDDSIVDETGVYGTHHVGASTEQAQMAIADETVRIVEEYLRSGQAINCVNVALTTPATILLTVRMKNRPGVLAHVFYILGQAGINIEQMQNIIYEGAEAACAHIGLDERPSDELLTAIRANPHVVSASLGTI